MSNTVSLAVAQASIGARPAKSVNFVDMYTVEIITSGTITTLVVDIEGSLSGAVFSSLVGGPGHDVVANGNMFHISAKGVDFIRSNITTLTGGGAVSIIIKAK